MLKIGKAHLLLKVALSILIFYISSELVLYGMHKLKVIHLATRQSVEAVVKASEPYLNIEPAKPWKASGAIYIPHPYFGYVYTPSNTFLQTNPAFGNALSISTNSEGFPDDEFPASRSEDVVVYGLMGGSGAMSWGVEKKEERISSVLEGLLNRHAQQLGERRRFRVLNMGIGGLTQYQATQMFFYYAYLLDGVIMYAGHNEIAHADILERAAPVRYPLADVLSAIRIESPAKYRIYALRQDLYAMARKCLKKLKSVQLPSLRWYCEMAIDQRLRKIDEVNRKFSKELSNQNAGIPVIRDGLRAPFPFYDDKQRFLFFFSKKPQDADYRRVIMERLVPLVYTNPIIDAGVAAKAKKIRFLNVIQPLIASVDKPYTSYEVSVIEHPAAKRDGYESDAVQYEVTGLHILRKETQKISQYRITTIDLNARNGIFRNVKEDVFIDPVHLNARGNRLVAEYLFGYIEREWLR